MNKLFFIIFMLITGYINSLEWVDIAKEPLDINEQCIFYDAWNDVIVFDKPIFHIYKMYQNKKVSIITHYIKLPTKPNNVDVFLWETLE